MNGISKMQKPLLFSFHPRHEDSRGSFQELMRSDQSDYDLKNVAQVSHLVIEPGKVRGGHWHRFITETFLILRGRVWVMLEWSDGERQGFPMVNNSENNILVVPPMVKHTFEGDGKCGAELLILSNRLFDPKDPDTYVDWQT